MAQRQNAEAEARVAMARYQQTVLRAFVQVSDVLAALAADGDQMANRRLGIAVGEGTLREAEDGYKLGGVTLMQMAEARRRLNHARRDLAQAQGQQFLDLVQLYAATAADWRAATATAAP